MQMWIDFGQISAVKEMERRVEKAVRKNLTHGGAILRKSARQSIRTRQAVSKPFSPPTNRTGKLKNHILYAWAQREEAVYVGARKWSNSNAQAILERGGMVLLPEIYLRREFGVGLPGNRGGIGPVAIRKEEDEWTFPWGFGKKDPKSKTSQKGWSREVHVIWRHLRTEKEVQAAERNYATLLALRKIHPTNKKMGKVLPRPYMSAALKRCQNTLIKLWRDSL